MYIRPKISTSISKLLGQPTLKPHSPYTSTREVLSPKKNEYNLLQDLAPKPLKNDLRLDLDQMLQMARTQTNNSSVHRQGKLVPDFGYLGKRSVVQFEAQENKNYDSFEDIWKEDVEIDETSSLFQSRKVNSPNKNINQAAKSRYDKFKSPAVIGHFADDTSSQKGQRVRCVNFLGLRLDQSKNGDAEVIDVLTKSDVQSEGISQIEKKIQAISVEGMSVNSYSESFEKQFNSRQDKLKDIERRFSELQEKIRQREIRGHNGDAKDPGKLSCIAKINIGQKEHSDVFEEVKNSVQLKQLGKKTVFKYTSHNNEVNVKGAGLQTMRHKTYNTYHQNQNKNTYLGPHHPNNTKKIFNQNSTNFFRNNLPQKLNILARDAQLNKINNLKTID